MKHPLYLVYPDSAESGTLETLPETDGLEIIRESTFIKILNKPIFVYKKQLAFGVYTLDESLENIDRLLEIDFNDYFKPVS